MIFKCVIALFVALSIVSAQNATTVILVRHAERAASDSMSNVDRGLSPAGQKRAQQLAHVLADANIQAIYTSTKPRTIDTARPTAERLHLTPRRIDDVAAIAHEILANPGRTTLVVHHSNTVPAIMDALGVKSVPGVGDSQYDWLFVVTVNGPGNARLVALHYGD